ncbi:unnamed protein product, partial [Rotaria sp. Silwood2]
SYNGYVFNFCSILKSQYDITCHHIRPDQVMSLTLSDDDETPNQSKLFFSHFNIEQFINLRAFNMSSINSNTYEQLYNLQKLKNLSSLELPRLFQPSYIAFDSIIRELLSRLYRLTAYNTYYLLDQSLPCLRHLTLKQCNCEQFSILLNRIPHLHSLNIILSIDIHTDWSNYTTKLIHLKRLILTLNGEKVTMIQMKQFLSKLPNLTHFQFSTQGDIDLLEGQQWELLVSHLIIFDFHIRLLCSSFQFSIKTILNSFRSSFWLEDKRWFVACDGLRLENIFTIPCFVSNIVTYPYVNWPPLCTSSDFNFDPYIKCLQLSLLNPVPHRFTNITSIVINTDEILTDLGLLGFVNLVEHMPYLNTITLRDLSVLNFVPNNVTFTNIRNLYVRHVYNRDISQLTRLCTIFSRLERLHMKLISWEELFFLIDQLKYLSIAKFKFYYLSSFVRDSYQSSSMIYDRLIKNSRRLQANNNFTYQYMNNQIHLWMNQEKVKLFLNKEKIVLGGYIRHEFYLCCQFRFQSRIEATIALVCRKYNHNGYENSVEFGIAYISVEIRFYQNRSFKESTKRFAGKQKYSL